LKERIEALGKRAGGEGGGKWMTDDG